ncbi:MAG: undecaprenyl diphosphate synthase family protein, partial [Spirochaetaceae bacterium]|nr:undecaprenyl diphosphate synthase family protein [Spirochaetaceae bacterium]
YFSDVFWPDWTFKNLDDAFQDYSKRQRRFGGVPE